MAKHPLRVQTRRYTGDGASSLHSPQCVSPLTGASGTTSRAGIVRRVGSPAVTPMQTESPLSSPIHPWSPSHVRAFSPTARAWSPSIRPQVLGRAAAYAAQSLVDAVARSMTPSESLELRARAQLMDEPAPMLERPHTSSGHIHGFLATTPTSKDLNARIVAPQARHGAVWLEMGRTNKRPRRRRVRLRQERAGFGELFSRAVSCIRMLMHPRQVCHAVSTSVRAQRGYWDEAFRDPTSGQRCWRPPWLNAYIPLLIWLCVSVCSSTLVLLFHTQVFQALDAMSHTLRELGVAGRIVLGAIIFLTTFPPMPLYSTLVVVSGFAFGMWQGFLVSYTAALSGAITVFVLSRSLMRAWMIRLLNQSGGLKRVVHAIEKRPQLLFLVRLAPYPYNLLNTLLASSPTLTLRTYVMCTALPLFKLLVHTALGSSIQNFSTFNDAHANSPSQFAPESSRAARIHHIAGVVGLVLCITVLLYLAWATQRAVDEIEDADCSESESDSVSDKGFDDEDTPPMDDESAATKNEVAYPLLAFAQEPETIIDPIAEMELAAEAQHRSRTWA